MTSTAATLGPALFTSPSSTSFQSFHHPLLYGYISSKLLQTPLFLFSNNYHLFAFILSHTTPFSKQRCKTLYFIFYNLFFCSLLALIEPLTLSFIRCSSLLCLLHISLTSTASDNTQLAQLPSLVLCHIKYKGTPLALDTVESLQSGNGFQLSLQISQLLPFFYLIPSTLLALVTLTPPLLPVRIFCRQVSDIVRSRLDIICRIQDEISSYWLPYHTTALL